MLLADRRHKVLSVSEITRAIKGTLENKYNFVRISGEISNLKRPFSGHSYFTLKDDGAQLRTVLFKGQLRYLEKDIKDGQRVICHGRISVYEPRGDYQLIVDTVDFQGTGILQQRFIELKNRLEREGLFESDRKQQIPAYPEKIAIITSPTGAAIHDFLKIWRNRQSTASIQIYPVRVQGSGAVDEIAEAIKTLNDQKESGIDLIVLCRGGGSLEDLWAFNEEKTARAIARSKLPLVSAIGHEIDFTIADFCADLRAPTPTGAAEQLLPDNVTLRRQLISLKRRLSRNVFESLSNYSRRISQAKRLLGDMSSSFNHYSLKIDHAATRLCHNMARRIQEQSLFCQQLEARLHNFSPTRQITLKEQKVAYCLTSITQRMHSILQEKESLFVTQAVLLDAVSPLATLSRGYSITRKLSEKEKQPKVITDGSMVSVGDRLEILLRKGKLACRVTDIKENRS